MNNRSSLIFYYAKYTVIPAVVGASSVNTLQFDR